MIQTHSMKHGRPAQALARGLIERCGGVLTAVADDRDAHATEESGATDATAVSPPAQEATRPGAHSTGVGSRFTDYPGQETDGLYDPWQNASTGASRSIAPRELVDAVEFSVPDSNGPRKDEPGATKTDHGNGAPGMTGRGLIGDETEGKVSRIGVEQGQPRLVEISKRQTIEHLEQLEEDFR